MVNPDSDLFRAHPDWVLSGSGRPGLPGPWRHQQVLDLANPTAALHPRPAGRPARRPRHRLPQVGPQPRPGRGRPRGRPGVHAQTLAVYRLLDELRARHPGVEIESCASGGAGSTWGSCTGPTGSGPATPTTPWSASRSSAGPSCWSRPSWSAATSARPAHTTGRVHGLAFRVATALFGHFGIEWDIASASAAEQEALAEAIAFYKRVRPLLHSGQVVQADHPNPAAYLHGVVAADRAEALFAYVQLTRLGVRDARPGPAARAGPGPRLPGRAGGGRRRARDQAGDGPGVAGGGRGHPRRPVWPRSACPCPCSGPSRPCCST